MTPEPPAGGTPREWKNTEAGLLTALAGFYFLLAVPDGILPTWVGWVVAACGALIAALVFLINHTERKNRMAALEKAEQLGRQALEAEAMATQIRQQTIEKTHGYIKHGLDEVVSMAANSSAEGRRDAKERLKQLIVDLACGIRSDARAVFYTYQETDSSRILKWEGVWKAGDNRYCKPRPEFREGDRGPGDEVLRMIDTGEPIFVPDVSKQPRHLQWRDQPQAREYETYITVPVASNGKKFGFIGVDCPTPGDLTQEDGSTLRILAKILTVGLLTAGQTSTRKERQAKTSPPA